MRWVIAAALVLTSGCFVDRSGLRLEGDAGGVDASVGDGGGMDGSAVDGGTSDASADAVVPFDAPGDDAGFDAGFDAGCDIAGCPGRRCDGTACLHYASCDALHSARPGEPSGVYEIDPDGSGALQVYCEMVTDGGWTLIMKMDGSQTTFRYGAGPWTDMALMNETSLDLSLTEAKLETFLRLPLTELRVGMQVSGTNRWINLPVSAASMHELMNGGFSASSVGRSAWLGLLPSPSLQSNCNREGINVRAGGVNVRIGILGNNESSCDSPNSMLGFGANSHEACDYTYRTSVGNGRSCGGRVNTEAWGFIFGR